MHQFQLTVLRTTNPISLHYQKKRERRRDRERQKERQREKKEKRKERRKKGRRKGEQGKSKIKQNETTTKKESQKKN